MFKQFRITMLALAAIFCGSAFAEDIIWSEDWSGYAKDEVPSAKNSAYSETNGGGTTKIYEEALAGGTSPELLVAKSGGSFAAVVSLNGKTGDFVLSFKSNRDLQVTVTDATLGEVTKTGNDYSYPLTVSEGTSTISITFTTKDSKNARLDDIKLYQGTAKLPAGLSWGKASASVTLGADDNQFLTLSNENNLTVTYSSSDENVATIDSEGNITLITAGTTNISATFDGDDNFEAQTVTYTLTVKAATSDNPDDPDTPVITESITVAQALEIIEGLETGATTSEDYTVKGYIVGNPDFQRKTDGTLYGNVNFEMADVQGGTTTITIFRAKSYNNEVFTEETISLLKEGDLVEVKGNLKKFEKDGTITPEVTNGNIVSINGENGSGGTDTPDTPDPDEPIVTEGDGSEANPYTIADLQKMAVPTESSAAEGQEKVWVKGFIVGALNSAGTAFAADANTNLALAATAEESDAANTIPVQLPKGDMRDALNVVDNPSLVGKEIMLYGYILKYFSRTGLKEVSDFKMSEIVEITEDGWKSYVPQNDVAIPDDARAFIVTAANKTQVTLTQVSEVPAGTPIIINAEEGFIELNVISGAEAVEGNLLKVVQFGDAISKDDNVYVLANIDSNYGVGFYRWDGDYLSAGIVYLQITDATREFIGFGEATAIKSIGNVQMTTDSYYNLNGQRVVAPKKGLYILNGKKSVVR